MRLCELSGRVPPELGLRWRGLCSVMLLSQQQPATACLLVSASGPDDGALESSLSPPPLACYLLPETLCAVMLAFVTIKLELFDHPLPSNKAVQTSEEAPLHILGLPLIVGWEGGQHRLMKEGPVGSFGLLSDFRSDSLGFLSVCLKLGVLGAPDEHSLSTAVGTGRPDRSQPLCELLTMRELKPSVSVSCSCLPRTP